MALGEFLVFAMIAKALVLMLAASTLWPTAGVADGALAVGLPANVARQGFANGYSWDNSTMETARTRAIEGCRESRGASKIAKDLCRVVATFRDQCVAVAIDPKDGTPGAGWAIGESQRAADQDALAQCRATAGTARQRFCAVSDRACDGSAK